MKTNHALAGLLVVMLLHIGCGMVQGTQAGKVVTISGKIPEIVDVNFTEASGVDMGNLFPFDDTVTATGNASISSTMNWQLRVSSWGNGDGYMWTADGLKKLQTQFMVKAGTSKYWSLPPKGHWITLASDVPGQYYIPTGYMQSSKKNDGFGRYYATVDWNISPNF